MASGDLLAKAEQLHINHLRQCGGCGCVDRGGVREYAAAVKGEFVTRPASAEPEWWIRMRRGES